MYVTDLKRRKQWGAIPGSTGFIRDFYRLEDQSVTDPAMAERALSKIESEIAPILRDIDRERRSPTAEEVEPLLYFIGLQWTRVPAFRPIVLRIIEDLSDEKMRENLESAESWSHALEAAGISPSEPGAD